MRFRRTLGAVPPSWKDNLPASKARTIQSTAGRLWLRKLPTQELLRPCLHGTEKNEQPTSVDLDPLIAMPGGSGSMEIPWHSSTRIAIRLYESGSLRTWRDSELERLSWTGATSFSRRFRKLYDVVLEPDAWKKSLPTVVSMVGGDSTLFLEQALRTGRVKSATGCGQAPKSMPRSHRHARPVCWRRGWIPSGRASLGEAQP